MKTKLVLLAAMAGLSWQTACAADGQAGDRIAAVVENQVITQSRLDAALAQVRRTWSGAAQMSEVQLRNQVLAQLINEALLVQAGKRYGLQLNESEIDAAVEESARMRQVSAAQLYEQEKANGLGRKAVRRQAANAVLLKKMQQQLWQQQGQVSEQEVDAAIAHMEKQGVPVPDSEPVWQYRARHILIKADQALAAAAAETTINKLWQELRQGQDFAQLAKRYSQDMGSAVQGGDLGWFGDGVMVPEFEAAVKSLQAGEVSRPVKSQFGWHLIRLDETREVTDPQVRRRTVVRRLIGLQKVEQAQAALLAQLQQTAYVDVRLR